MEKDRKSGTSPAAYPTWVIRSKNSTARRRKIFSPTCKHRRVGVESDVVDSIPMLEQRHSHVMEKMFYGRCFHHSPAAEG
jgi:hypothetical protein